MQSAVKRTQYLIILGIVSIFVMCFSLSGVAQAALVTFNFEGKVVAPVHPILILNNVGISVGTPFSGSYTFESTTPDLRNLQSNVGQYAYTDLSITLLGQTYSLDTAAATVRAINVVNNADPLTDGYAVLFSRSPFVGGSPEVFTLQIAKPGLFSDDALPLTPFSLNGLTNSSVAMGGFGPLAPFGVAVLGGLTSLTLAPVPLPGAILLFGTSLIGLVGLGYRRRMGKS
jgi:hypothetical protein